MAGQVALITGAARGQGRAHAVRLAAEGADIVGVDICRQLPTVPYPMATTDDLEETARLVRKHGRRIVIREVDVRDAAALEEVAVSTASEMGPIGIVIANAGICAPGSEDGSRQERMARFRDIIDVNLVGIWNTVQATAPAMIEAGRGGSIVLTSSTQGLSGRGGDGSAAISAYAASKHGVVGLMRSFATWLASYMIRVNSVHPTGVATPMIENDFIRDWATTHPGGSEQSRNLMPVDMVEDVDISNAVAWLVSDEARYVTGVTLPVDAGFAIR